MSTAKKEQNRIRAVYRGLAARLQSVAAAAIVSALAAGLIGSPAVRAAENQAAAMRMEKMEGVVGVTTSTGRELSVSREMRLYNGYEIATEQKSYAWINLDSTKLVKMDALSKAGIRKSGKKLEVLLEAGNIFFDVSKPLEDDESLNIHTSTMTTGIRGTSGWLEVIDASRVRVSILEGTVQIKVTDQLTGQVKTESISGGETAVCVVYEEEAGGAERCDILRESYQAEDISGFVLAEVIPDQKLCETIFEESGLDLRRITQEDVREKLQKDEQKLQEKLDGVENAVKAQKARIAVNAVWTRPPETPQKKEPVLTAQVTPPPAAPAEIPEIRNTETPDSITPPAAEAPPNTVETPGSTTPPDTAETPGGTVPPGTAETPGGTVPPGTVETPGGTNPNPLPGGEGGGTDTPGGSGGTTASPELIHSYDPDTKTLTLRSSIPGEEVAMPDYEFRKQPWAEYAGEIDRVVIEEGVTSIGEMAFQFCFALTRIDIPNSVTSIGTNALGASGLTEITIPDSVTSIGSAAFMGCGRLTKVKLPSAITRIADGLFNGCSKLAQVEIPDGVTSIGFQAFSSCSSLTEFSFPNNITSIGISAFTECSGLTQVEIPNGVTSIGRAAFRDCTSLRTIKIPESVKSLDVLDFANCSSLTELLIPASAGNIYADSFGGCTSLTKVTIQGNVTNILESAFENYTGRIEIQGDVTNVGAKAFYHCTGLEAINISGDATSIGNSAFEGCTGLREVTISGDATNIGSSAFKGCTGLSAVTISGNVTSIGLSAFDGCKDAAITIPGSVVSIGPRAFYGCEGLETINLSESITDIGRFAFEGCSGLKAITIPNSVTFIDYLVFSGCSSLTEITIPASVTWIGNGAFWDCTNLKTIVIQGLDTSIAKSGGPGPDAFANCTPDNVYFIGTEEQWNNRYSFPAGTTMHYESFGP